jgi:hypothetical protein
MYQEQLRLFEIGDKGRDIIITCIGFVEFLLTKCHTEIVCVEGVSVFFISFHFVINKFQNFLTEDLIIYKRKTGQSMHWNHHHEGTLTTYVTFIERLANLCRIVEVLGSKLISLFIFDFPNAVF